MSNNGTAFALDIENERLLIAELLKDPGRLTKVASITEADFALPAHRVVFGAIQAMRDNLDDVAAVSVANLLHARGQLEDVGGLDGLKDLVDAVPYSVHAEYHARLVKEASARRMMLRKLREAQDMAADPSTTLTDVVEFVDGIPTYLRDTGAGRLKWYSSKALAETLFVLEYLIPGVLVRGQPGLIAGGKKSLKTSILIDLVISLVSLTPFLGKFPIARRARCGIISAESGAATIRETALRVADSSAKRLNLADLDGLHWCFDVPQLADTADLGEIERFIVREGLEVLAVDPTYLTLDPGDNASNLFSMGKLLAKVSALGQRTGCTLLLCHHAKRNVVDPTGPAELGDVAWAGFPEWARQWLLLSRREPYEPGSGLHKLWLSAGGSAGHSGLWGVDISEGTQDTIGGRFWTVAVCTPEDARDAADVTAEEKQAGKGRRRADVAKQRIRGLFEANPDPRTKDELKRQLSLQSTPLKTALAELVTEGAIEACDVARNNGQKYAAFRPVGNSREHPVTSPGNGGSGHPDTR